MSFDPSIARLLLHDSDGEFLRHLRVQLAAAFCQSDLATREETERRQTVRTTDGGLFLGRSYKWEWIMCVFNCDWSSVFVSPSSQRRSWARLRRRSWIHTWRTWSVGLTAPRTGLRRSWDKQRCCCSPTQVREEIKTWEATSPHIRSPRRNK